MLPEIRRGGYPAEVEIRRGGTGRDVVAYCAVFGVESEIKDQHGHYRETISRAAFRDRLAEGIADISVLFNHGYNAAGKPDGLLSVPIGSPVDIRTDHKGLLTVTRFNKGPVAEQALEAIKAGDVKGFSFRGPVYESFPSRVPTIRRGGELPRIERRRLGLVEYGPTKTPFYEGASVVAVRARTAVDDADEPYGDVPYADPGYQDDGVMRYPLDSERHVRAAWSYIHQADNANRYTARQLRLIKARIRMAGQKYGIEYEDEEAAMRSRLTLPDDDAVRFAGQFSRIFAVATEEPVLMRSIAAGLAWRDPDAADEIERALRVIHLRQAVPRYREVETELQIIRARLEELAAMDEPDTGDEDEDEEILAARADEIDELADRADELDEEAESLLGGDVSEEDDANDEAYQYA